MSDMIESVKALAEPVLCHDELLDEVEYEALSDEEAKDIVNFVLGIAIKSVNEAYNKLGDTYTSYDMATDAIKLIESKMVKR